MSILDSLFQRRGNARELKNYDSYVEQINAYEPALEQLSDADLKTRSETLLHKVRSETPERQSAVLEEILPEAFALVREASKRTLGQRHFDVQLKGGMVIHRGKIVEMKTGEGKTLVATLPSYLNGLTGRGVHIVTVNDYLARRDAVWMGQIHHALGLTIGCITQEEAYVYDPSFIKKSDGNTEGEADQERDETGSFRVVHEYLRPVPRSQAYAADITYGTNNIFGFDYLRDNLAHSREQLVQRDYYFAIIDEIDSILIDEARTPLIISSADEESSELYLKFSHIAPQLTEGVDYNVDEKQRAVSLSDKGIDAAERLIGVKNLYSGAHIDLVYHLEQALRAKVLFHKDKDYIVKDDKVVIVDEFTGRLMPDRRYSEGLHQALEAKEGVKIKEESRTLATITFQNLFRKYPKLSGMTGTAATSREEFGSVYGLDVIELPTHRPMVRIDNPDFVYTTETGKYRAIINEVRARHEKGQPVLIGTVSIEKNELLATLLKEDGIPHEVLNAKNHEREAQIIAQAGHKGSVTVATNMAGRGVDIKLGGNPCTDEEANEIRALGGLFVLGTERHEARRIDNQLRGRSGRQGDQGETRFFVSMDDDVMRIFGGDRPKSIMQRLGLPEDVPIENSMISKAIERAQTSIEGHNFDIRKYVLRYDEVLNKQREAIYSMRRKILMADVAMNAADKKLESAADAINPIRERVVNFFEEEIVSIASIHTPGDEISGWNVEEIGEAVRALLNVHPPITDSLRAVIDGSGNANDKREHIIEAVRTVVFAQYEQREKAVGIERLRNLEKVITLSSIDMLWTMHLDHMQRVRDAVRLRAYGQKDPLVEYKREGNIAFKNLLVEIRTQVISAISKIQVVQKDITSFEEKQPTMVLSGPSKSALNPFASSSPDSAAIESTKTTDPRFLNIGRNDPCPCGSGKKFKKCHGA